MAGLGAAIDAPLPLGLLGPQSAIHLPGTDGQKLPLRRCAQPKPLSHPRHPDRQQRLQPHRPRVTGRFPNGRQNGQCFLAIAQRTSPRPPNGLLSWGRTVQKPNRVFPVVAGVETEFVQDHMFYPVPRLAVTLIDGSQVLPFRLMAHRNPPQKPSELGYILNGAITPSRVTFRWLDTRRGRRPQLPWPRTPLRPKRAKRRRWAPLRPRPRKRLSEVQGWGIFDRNYGEFSTGIDTPPGPQPTTLSFTAASAATSDFDDSATVQARLTKTSDGTPVPGKMITFTLGSGSGAPTCSATTDATGTATCSLTPNQPAGPQTLTADFAGDSTFGPSSASTTFTVTKEETVTKFTATSPTLLANGMPAAFSATLKEDGVTPISGGTLTFTLGSGAGAQSCSGATNASSTASCSIVVNQPLGRTPWQLISRATPSSGRRPTPKRFSCSPSWGAAVPS